MEGGLPEFIVIVRSAEILSNFGVVELEEIGDEVVLEEEVEEEFEVFPDGIM